MKVCNTPKDSVVTGEAAPPLKFKTLVGFVNFVIVFGFEVAAKSAMKVFVIKPKVKLKSNISVVVELQVNVIVGESCTTSKGYCTVNVRKNVETMPPTLLDCKRRMKRHPIYKVSKLT